MGLQIHFNIELLLNENKQYMHLNTLPSNPQNYWEQSSLVKPPLMHSKCMFESLCKHKVFNCENDK